MTTQHGSLVGNIGGPVRYAEAQPPARDLAAEAATRFLRLQIERDRTEGRIPRTYVRVRHPNRQWSCNGIPDDGAFWVGPHEVEMLSGQGVTQETQRWRRQTPSCFSATSIATWLKAECQLASFCFGILIPRPSSRAATDPSAGLRAEACLSREKRWPT